MDTDSIKKRIRNLINDKFEINEEISDTDYLVNFGLGVDSVSSLEFVVALEKEYGLEIDESEITPDILKNINSISDYVSKKL
jgi:acyl carrier protein